MSQFRALEPTADVGDWLKLLARDDPGRARELAARRFRDYVVSWAPAYLAGKFRRMLLRAGCDTAAVIDDAVQHLLVVASVGTSRFRGETQASAVSWCKAILRNFVLSEVRLAARHESERPDHHLREAAPAAAAVAPEALLDLTLAVERELGRTRRARDVPQLMRSFCVFLEHKLGHEALLRVRESRPALFAIAESIGGARVRKQRQRGREVGAAALAALQERGALPCSLCELSSLVEARVHQRRRAS